MLHQHIISSVTYKLDKNQFIQFPSLPPKTSLGLILEIKPEVKGTIFLEDLSLAKIKENWENDLETNISDDQWSKILKNVHSLLNVRLYTGFIRLKSSLGSVLPAFSTHVVPA